MTKIDLLTIDGTKQSTIDLPAFFTAVPKATVLHQAVVAYLANARQGNAHTKTRGEVSGGGRKPWKQKGTGRARAGSSRSPIWVGGGITFGPRSVESYAHRLPAKLRRLALSMALSTKATAGKLIVVDSLPLPEAKTKLAAAAIGRLAPDSTSVMIVTEEKSQPWLRAAANLPSAAIMTVSDLNTYDVLNFDTLIFTEAALKKVPTIFAKGEE